ncbi:MAG: hypothetical protein QNJ13_03315 [Paracoccaceae bacterium]|nr:hypothetical protein [Paracoccaceae bacterium]
MSIMEDIADGLAKRALEIAIAEDDDKVVKAMADAIANSSPTLEEAFLTAVRFRRGEYRAMEVLKGFQSGGG